LSEVLFITVPTPAHWSSWLASISCSARTDRHWSRTNTHTERSAGTFCQHEERQHETAGAVFEASCTDCSYTLQWLSL